MVRIAAGVLLQILLFGVYQIWRRPFAVTNKIGFSALLAFLVVYLVRFLLTPLVRQIKIENRLVIDAEAITVNNNRAPWENIEKAELKDRNNGKCLEVSIAIMRQGNTAPERTTLFVWQIERYGDMDEIVAQINRHLKSPVVDRS